MASGMTHPRDELRGLVRSMRLLVASEREAGAVDVVGTPAPPVAAPPVQASAHLPRAAARAAPVPSHPTLVPPLDLPADALAPFGDLPSRVASCTKCGLCETRTLTVFGEGVATARLVFCGEGPGFDEDRSGRPFVGRAGELLSDMIVKGMKMLREDVFILNAVKCRPPENRTPAPEEILACKPFLAGQLAVIRPAVIVALGNPASQALLGTVPGITKIRGQVFEAYGAKVVPTYHPAFLLRDPTKKRETWADLQLVMRLLAPPG
jgi:uracil-DNA glycosylase family 4